MAVNVNDMSIQDAAKYYASLGVITHPLHGPDAKVNSPGKQPTLSKWQKLERPFTDGEIESKYSDVGNLGFVCGKRSDLTVLDIDWAVKGLWDNILKGVDTSDWVKQDHTELKYHYLFRYFNDIKAKTYPGLGFDVLSDTTQVDSKTGLQYTVGNNCVAAPSTHPDGNKYKITGNIDERPVIPEIVINRINNVVELYKEITDKILPKCRGSFQGLWDVLFIDKKHKFYHKTSIFVGDKENRDRHLHMCAELKANGATYLHLALVCMMILGDRYDPITTEKELQQIKPMPATTESILKDPYLSGFFTESDGKTITEKKVNGISNEGKPKKINIPFDVVADRIRDKLHIFTMRDNKQLYIYKDGVYRSEGAEALLDTEIRDIHNEIYRDSWDSINPNIPIIHIPKATVRYVNEVLAHIRAYTHIIRDSLEKVQLKYINFKNCLFNLETWKTEDHNPEMKSICQIPVTFDKDAKCPKISDFLKSVVAEPDINLLCEMAGYCLTTDCSQQKAFMLYGEGSNGKSVFLALLEALVGKENTSGESLHKLEFDKYRLAKLYGKRVNICSDIPDIKMQKSENFKKLTSGLDLIDGENKYQDQFTFKNTTKMVFSANDIPEGKKDKAYYRRWILIRFPNNFEGEKADKSLIMKLQTPEELSGFLNLVLDGLKRLRKNGKFSNEKSVEATQKEYEFNSNPIAAFMDERTQITDEDCDATLLYLEYVDWCQSCGKQHMTNIGFSRKLNGMGYTSHRENVQDGYCTKKLTKLDNLKIKKDKIGQDTKQPKIYPVLVCLISENPR